MGLLALPLIIFYFGSGGIALLIDKKRRKRKPYVSDDVASILDDEPTPLADLEFTEPAIPVSKVRKSVVKKKSVAKKSKK
jgi:hypothetical protein